MGDLGITKVVVLHCDNQSAIILAQNPVFHGMMHIQVKYHFIIDVIDSKSIEFVSVQIDDNPTDLLMRGLPAKQFAHVQQIMGVGQIYVFALCTYLDFG